MSPHKRKCDVLGFIGTTLLLLNIVTCSSIGTAMPTFGQKQTSNSLCNKGSNCLMYSRVMNILSCSTVHFTHSRFQSIPKLSKYRYLTAKYISLFMMPSRIWKLNGRDCDEHVMFYATQLPQLTCYWINYRKIKETYLLDPGHNHLFDGIIVQRPLVQLLNNKHQQHKHTGEYKLYLKANLPLNQYQRIGSNKYYMHIRDFKDLHKSAFSTIYSKKQLGVLTIIKNGDMDSFTFPVFNSLYDHMTTDWNIKKRFRKRSNDQHLSGSVEHLNDHRIIVYDEELFGFQNNNWTDKQMMEAYSEILKSFTKSEHDSHNLNGGDRILPDHLGSIMGIEATVLLTLLLLSNLSIRIVNKKDCSKASSSHSKILKVAAKERRQNFPTENQAKGVRLCEMCVNQNSTVAHCKTCKLYICAACSILHERVWALMNHTLCPFKEI